MFKLHSKFEPTGDQPEAIKGLVEGIERGEKYQTLLGGTGSRKNFYYGKYSILMYVTPEIVILRSKK